MTHQHPHPRPDSTDRPGQQQRDDHDQAELLDLDAEVLAEHVAAIITWLPVATEPRHVVDLGTGTGAGTFALLRQFPGAEVTAVDASANHLHRLRQRAEADGVADRVRTVLVDLDADWPDLGQPDLVWASASVHHLMDPDRALGKVHDLLLPGGLFAVVELADFPRFLPEEAPENRPGVEDRAHAALAHHHAGHVSHRGADWGPRLTAAGFTIAGERSLSVHVEGAATPAVGRYALTTLGRLRASAADALDAADVEALDQLLDTTGPHSILRRGDLAVRTQRTVWAASRR